MTHSIKMGNDGILRAALIGDVTRADFDAYQRDLTAFIDASTPQNPLHIILDTNQTGKLSSAMRQGFTQLNRDLRIGSTAILNADRQIKVFVNFLLKATQRNNVNFFESDDDASRWIMQIKSNQMAQEKV